MSDFDAYLRAAGRSGGTRSLRRHHVLQFADHAAGGPLAATAAELVDYLGREDWGPNTRRSALASLRVFFRWLVASGHRAEDPTAMLAPVRGFTGQPRPCPEHYLRRAITAAPERERLMLALAATAGLRRAEVATVRGDQLAYSLDGPSLRVLGKGHRERLVPIGAELADAIAARGAGWTFPGQIDGHLSPAYVGKCISRLLPPGWTAHTLRHRFASAAYRADRDIRAVQELLGHASVATTQIYTAVPDDARRRAALAAVMAA